MLTGYVLSTVFGRNPLPWYFYIPFLLMSPILFIIALIIDIIVGILSFVVFIILLPFRILWYIVKSVYQLVRRTI